jgi:predicted flap endonuclease-1-like 5' DNA nuclease
LPYPIGDIEGIGAAHAQTLMQAGIRSTDQLVDACRTPRGRKAIAAKTGLSEEELFRWTNLADVSRIRGVAKQYLELLNSVGVRSMRDLKVSKADALSQSLKQSNEEKHLCKVSPSIAVVRKWIDQAKTLGSKVTHK